MTGTVPRRPLEDVRVVDLVGGPCSYVGAILASLGADVILVEPAQRINSHGTGEAGAAQQLAFMVRNANKRGVSIDFTDSGELRLFDQLLASADIFLHDKTVSEIASLGYDREKLRAVNSVLVTAAITEFGHSGPRAGRRATAGVHFALSTVLSRSGITGFDTPLLPPDYLAYHSASIQAAWTVMLGYWHALGTGSGEYVDFSVQDALLHVLDPPLGSGGTVRDGKTLLDLPPGRPDINHLYPIFPVKDGFVRICIASPGQWQSMLTWIGRPPELTDPKLDVLGFRQAAHKKIFPYYERHFANMTRTDAVDAGQRLGVPIAGLLALTEVLDEPSYHTAGSLIRMEIGPGVTTVVPGGAIKIDGTRAGIRTPAPSLGQHRAEVFGSLDRPRRARRRQTGGTRPFSGLRVLDLGVAIVGAELGRMFADHGADVIKVECREFPDGARQYRGSAGMSDSFAVGHRNMRSLGLNLRQPAGLKLFKQLAAESDVVLSNFKPGTLDRLGIGHDVLSALNPRIIVSESSAFGDHGPWGRRMGYGPLVRASSALTTEWRYSDTPDSFADTLTIYPDHVAARINATAIISLLIRRCRTGLGGQVASAQVDVILAAMGERLALAGAEPACSAEPSNEPDGDAPSGVFRALGADEWVVIDPAGDQDFEVLAKVIGRDDWLTDRSLASAEGRRQRRAGLCAEMERWTRNLPGREIEEIIQGAGIPVGRMLRAPDLLEDAHLEARQAFGTLAHPQVGRSLPVTLSEAIFETVPGPPLNGAPLMGEHTREIASSYLGMHDSAIDRLIDSEILQEPDDQSGRQ